MNETILFNDDYFHSLFADIDLAKNTINLETYIFENDDLGRAIAQSLINATKRGVKVRILADAVGARSLTADFIKKITDSGIQFKFFHPLHRFNTLNRRNHRKYCVIDSQIVYVGSANIVDNHWRETGVKLINCDTKELDYAFNKAWGSNSLADRLHHALTFINLDPIFRLNYTWRLRRKLYKNLLERISMCSQRIWITNAYFIPDNSLLKRLIRAANKGVKVRIILPHESDVLISSLATTTFYSILLKKGILIYEYLPAMLHAKELIIDDWFLVGSSNLNYRSTLHDLEINVNVRDKNAKSQLENQFVEDMRNSKLITFEDLKKLSKFKLWIGRLLLIFRRLM